MVSGNHYNGCVYEGTSRYGSSSLGGSSAEKFVFAIFCIVGILFGILCPPLGAGIIILGAEITGV